MLFCAGWFGVAAWTQLCTPTQCSGHVLPALAFMLSGAGILCLVHSAARRVRCTAALSGSRTERTRAAFWHHVDLDLRIARFESVMMLVSGTLLFVAQSTRPFNTHSGFAFGVGMRAWTHWSSGIAAIVAGALQSVLLVTVPRLATRGIGFCITMLLHSIVMLGHDQHLALSLASHRMHVYVVLVSIVLRLLRRYQLTACAHFVAGITFIRSSGAAVMYNMLVEHFPANVYVGFSVLLGFVAFVYVFVLGHVAFGGAWLWCKLSCCSLGCCFGAVEHTMKAQRAALAAHRIGELRLASDAVALMHVSSTVTGRNNHHGEHNNLLQDGAASSSTDDVHMMMHLTTAAGGGAAAASSTAGFTIEIDDEDSVEAKHSAFSDGDNGNDSSSSSSSSEGSDI
jgi:hypothetical protein